MKKPGMSADGFRAELKRLELGQSAFAAVSGMSLRAVQSWALGERKIPQTIYALIEKVEGMSTKDKLTSLIEILPEKDAEAIVRIAEIFKKDEAAMVSLTAEVKALRKSDEEKQIRLEYQDKMFLRLSRRHELLSQEVDVLKKTRTPAVPFNAS